MTVKCSDHRKTKHDIMYKFVTENYPMQIFNNDGIVKFNRSESK